MAVVGRYNSKLLYFPEKLLEKLDTIKSEALTIVEAPLGYGKTTSVHHYMEESDLTYIWINIERKDDVVFFDKFCSLIRMADEKTADELKACGYPVDENSCNQAINILKDIEVNDNLIIVFDNFHNISDEMISKLLVESARVYNSRLRMVFLTQTLSTTVLSELIYNDEDVNYISKKDFEFTHEEIINYYRKCGIKLSEDEAVYLQKYTDGWISAIYLQLLYYIENKEFDKDISINELIGEMFWDRLSVNCQDLLIRLGLFGSFTIRQALMMADNKLSEKEIKDMLGSNKLIYYNKSGRKYTIHGILRFFLEEERKNLEPIFQNEIYSQIGRWYAGNGEFENAFKAFYKAKNYKAIYGMDFNICDIEGFVNNDNKQMFINIVSGVETEYKRRFLDSQIVMCLVLYIYHEKDFFIQECDFVRESLEEKEFISDKKRERLTGELKLLEALNAYNDVGRMKQYFMQAADYIKSPDEKISSGFTWTFKTPSVMFGLYRTDIKADETLKELEETLPYYYRITGGNGKGAEALMKAEILLNRMDFDGAEVLSHKALYMSETREQTNIYIGALYILARISVYKNDFDNIKYISRTIRKKMSDEKCDADNITVELGKSYLYTLLGRSDKINSWLMDSAAIEKKCVVYSLAYANMVFGRYLIDTEQYKKFLGISGQMLGIAGIYKSGLGNIYTYIYIAIANMSLNNDINKAVTFMMEAINIAKKDDIILPFVENYERIQNILSDSRLEKDEFVVHVVEYAKLYRSRFKIVENNANGLTKRENEIASLAAKRYTNKEIALQLHISENTVKSNLKMIYSKLGIANRSELTKIYE